jgi:putative ABC transport system permease protein
MLQNYLRIAFRGLWRKRTFSFLNIMGLAVGIAACLLLFLLIRHELSFDNFHSKRNRIYRVISAWTGGPEGNAYDEGVPGRHRLQDLRAVRDRVRPAGLGHGWV